VVKDLPQKSLWVDFEEKLSDVFHDHFIDVVIDVDELMRAVTPFPEFF